MKANTSSTHKSFRIILAIASKDILDALKNKSTLTALITMLFLVLMYKFLPNLNQEDPPFVFLYDAGQSTYLPVLENDPSMTVRVYDSLDTFIYRFRIHADAELGLVLPSEFDQVLAAGSVPTIQGYVLHWVSQEQVDEQRLDLESRISAIVGAPVRIEMTGGTLNMLPDSRGGFLAAAGTVIVIMMIGLVLIPNLVLEEKANRTMDALLVSPATSGQLVVAKALAGFFYCLLFIVMLFTLNGNFIIQWWLALITVFLATLMSIALGLIIGTIIKNRQQLLLIGNVIMFPLLLPIFLSLMTDLLPAWLITGMNWLPPVAETRLMLISFSDQAVFNQSLPRIGLMLATCVALLGWETWLVRRSDR